jgi:DNA-binding response OmpR family regulator
VTAKNIRVLIVDDDVTILDTLTVTLENEGFVVTTAINGRQGLVKIIDSQPDLVLLDVRLPDIDGFQVCRETRSNPRGAGIPIILMTGDMTVDIDRGFSLGADDCIIKPLDMKYLTSRIKKLAGGRTQILVVDDDRQIGDMLSKVISAQKYEPQVLTDGSNIMNVIKEKKPDLLLLDISLPIGPDGVEICRMLKSDPSTRDIPVIMLTANEYVDAVEKCFSFGAEDYLFKPFSIPDLVLRMKKYIAYSKKK